MKKLLLLSLVLLLSSCENNNLEYRHDFEKSYALWLQFKASCNDSYVYQVNNYSWVGVSWETTITIENGIPVRRSFKMNLPVNYPYEVPAEVREWVEEASDLNTHEDSSAAYPFTVDEIYEKARTEWLIKRDNARICFEALNNGLISSCGYIKDGCYDDCFTGIRIGFIWKIQTLL